MCAHRRTLAALAFAVAALSGCGATSREAASPADPWARGRLTFQPDPRRHSPSEKFAAGLKAVFPGNADGAWVYAPASAAAKPEAPLLLLLHGAGGSAARFIQRVTDLADQTGTIIVAAQSVAPTWDVLNGPIGPDVENIDKVLNRISSAYRIDPKRISIAGFSDGATYALVLGRLNGTLFRSIVAFSPGILIPVYPRGSPAIFISHGTRDTILPIDRASRSFVPELKRQGYAVEYHEFDGPHTVPPEIAAMAMRWISEH